jgi:hypothetical protein
MAKRVGATAAAAVLLGLSYAGTAAATPNAQFLSPPPDKVVVDLVTVNGSGCPVGSAAVSISEDSTAFTVTYSKYLAQVGIGSTPTDFRKNCQLGLRVHVPQGYTYAIAQTDYRGYASLAKGATAVEQANYYFQGTTPTARLQKTFTGPYENNWQRTDYVGVEALSWARCGAYRDLNINTELRVSAGRSNPARTTSFITMDSTDNSLSTLYHLAWKKC